MKGYFFNSHRENINLYEIKISSYSFEEFKFQVIYYRNILHGIVFAITLL